MQELHTLLANLDANKKRSVDALNEVIKLFTIKDSLLEGIQKTYTPLNEDSNYRPDNTVKYLATTVAAKIRFAETPIIKALDEELKRNETNRVAAGKLKIGDTFFELSVTSLMDLEKQVHKLKLMYERIPTLDLSYKWSPARIDVLDAYESELRETTATNQEFRVLELSKATKEHRAQVEKYTAQVPVGTWKTIRYSGRIPGADKSSLLARIDKLLEAIRTARSEANRTEIIEINIGETIFNYINEGII